MTQHAHRRLLFVLFFLSGACGLVYEILWTRMLTLIFGVTVYAVSAVLCAFMLGLALGSLVFGRLADRTRNPLRLYGCMEIGIAGFALLFPVLLESVKPLFIQIYKNYYTNYHVFSLMRFLIVLPLMLGPTILMGGTLPLLSRHFIRARGRFAHDLGLLYGINTAGAVAGTFLVGFILLAKLGIQHSIYFTAALNVAVGALAVGLSFGQSAPVDKVDEVAAEDEVDKAGAVSAASPFDIGRDQAFMVMAAISLSGFASLGLEVLWTRVLVFHTHNSTYAFSAMLMIFLTGLALGGWLLGLVSSRIRRPLLVFALLEAGIGLWAVFSMPLSSKLLRFNDILIDWIPFTNWYKALILILAKSAVMLLVPTTLMGMTFPLATRLVTARMGELGRKVGLVYAANTLGTVAGSFVVGFFFIPLFGLRNSFLAIAGLNLALAAGLLLAARPMARSLRWAGAFSCAAVLAACWFAVPRDVLMRVYSRVMGKIVYYNEEITDTIMVVDFPDKTGTPNKDLRWLVFSDGRGTAGHLTRQENHYCAHLPMLLHGDPKNVCVICIGSGNTIGAFKQYHGLESVDCVDLSAGIGKASQYFETNDKVFVPPVDPRIKLHAEDGRTFLLGSQKKFDVIQLEPPEMHTAGVIFLYTSDFYEICRSKLKPGGIVLQWINVWRMSDEETKICIASFQKVFPHGTVWQTPVLGHFLFVGTENPLSVNLQRVREQLAREPDVARQLASDNMDDLENFFSLLLMNEKTLAQYCEGVPAATDDKTIIDYLSPKAIFSGFGVMHLFSPVGWGNFIKGGVVPDIAAFMKGGWAYVSRLTAATDSIEPWIDYSGMSEAERQRTKARIEQCIGWRKWLASTFINGFVPSAPDQFTEHWLGSIYQPTEDPKLQYALIPNVTGTLEGAPLHINKLGLRGPEVAEKKPANTYRVLALGDSATFGVGVGDQQAWPAVLQSALNAVTSTTARVEVVNMGVPGYNAVQKVEAFEKVGLGLQPDAVVLQIDPQDVSIPPFIALSKFLHRKELDGQLVADVFTVGLHSPGALHWRDYGKPMPVRPEDVPERFRNLVGVAHLTEAYTHLVELCAERKIPLFVLRRSLFGPQDSYLNNENGYIYPIFPGKPYVYVPDVLHEALRRGNGNFDINQLSVQSSKTQANALQHAYIAKTLFMDVSMPLIYTWAKRGSGNETVIQLENNRQKGQALLENAIQSASPEK